MLKAVKDCQKAFKYVSLDLKNDKELAVFAL
jgi:hypothetical protein